MREILLFSFSEPFISQKLKKKKKEACRPGRAEAGPRPGRSGASPAHSRAPGWAAAGSRPGRSGTYPAHAVPRPAHGRLARPGWLFSFAALFPASIVLSQPGRLQAGLRPGTLVFFVQPFLPQRLYFRATYKRVSSPIF